MLFVVAIQFLYACTLKFAQVGNQDKLIFTQARV
jgi:hypothetical protein